MYDGGWVNIVELKRLLTDLRDKRPDICIRFRLLGEMWFPYFMKIVRVGETDVILNNEVDKKLVRVPDLSYVMQFEIDERFQNFKPHFHYNIKHSP